MSMQQLIQAQYRSKINSAVAPASQLAKPNEGWIKTVRKALNMSGAQLARQMGKTRAAVSNMEKAELNGGVTLNALEEVASAMGCRLVYAIVPETDIETIQQQQARKKAQAVVNRASGHMGLEAQALAPKDIAAEIDRLSNQFINGKPSDLWNN
jgi:predicted DNA-binding mobile mystery protein A